MKKILLCVLTFLFSFCVLKKPKIANADTSDWGYEIKNYNENDDVGYKYFLFDYTDINDINDLKHGDDIDSISVEFNDPVPGFLFTFYDGLMTLFNLEAVYQIDFNLYSDSYYDYVGLDIYYNSDVNPSEIYQAECDGLMIVARDEYLVDTDYLYSSSVLRLEGYQNGGLHDGITIPLDFNLVNNANSLYISFDEYTFDEFMEYYMGTTPFEKSNSNDGYDDGYDDGYVDGMHEGLLQGYENGYDDARDDLLNDEQFIGSIRDELYDDVLYDLNNEQGILYQTISDKLFTKWNNENENYTITGILGQLFDQLVSILNLEIFGPDTITLGQIILIPIGIGLILMIKRFIS